MRLLRADLLNFCRHSELHVEFRPGLNAVIGPNGCGKSTLIEGAAACITGAFNNFHGAKSSNICSLANAKDKASYTLTVALPGGQEAQLIRSLRPVGQKLKLGDLVLTKEGQIEDEVTRWLGMPPKTFVEFAFARQWQIFQILDDRASERADSLNRLFKLDRAEQCRNIIEKKLKTIRVPEMLVNEDSLKERILTDKGKIAELKAARKVLGEPDLQAEEQAHLFVNSFEHAKRLRRERSHTQAQLAFDVAELQSLKKSRVEIAKDIQNLKTTLNSECYVTAQDGIDVWRQVSAALAERTRLQTEFNNLQAQKWLAPLPVPEWTEEHQTVKSNLQDLKSHYGRFIKHFDPASGRSVCPECDTPMAQLRARYDEYQKKYAEIDAELKPLEARQIAWTQYSKRLAEYERWYSGWQAKCEWLQGQLQDLVIPAAPAASEVELRVYIDEANDLRKALSSLEAEDKGLELKIAGIDAKSKELNRRLLELDADLVHRPEDAQACEEKVAYLEQAAQAQSNRTRLEAQIEVLGQSIVAAEKELADAAPAKAKAAKIIEWRARLDKIRDIFHRDCLPRDIAQEYLHQLESRFNTFLEELGVDFRVRVADNLSFITYHTDGRIGPAERLSGGEKVVFALAWRLTVNSAFASDVGLLCLDEPTAGLDSERLICFRKALERLRFLSGTHGLQCVIVTHDHGLMPMFDHVIELKPAT